MDTIVRVLVLLPEQTDKLDFSVAKATLELLMSSEGVVILNLRCGYIENGVVISVCHINP